MAANPNTAREELLPCPFCGGNAVAAARVVLGMNDPDVHCKCGAYAETVEAWSRRAPASPAVGLEAVRDALLAAGGANPSVGKLRFSVWNLDLLARAFDLAVESTRMESRDV